MTSLSEVIVVARLSSPVEEVSSLASASSKSRNLIGMRLDLLSFLSGAIQQCSRSNQVGLNPRFLVQAPLNQARHVVYHSHNAGILNPHRTDDAERTEMFSRTKPVRRGDESAVSQRRYWVFTANDDVHVTFGCGLVARHTFIKDFYQARLFLKGTKQLTHTIDVNKIRLA